MKQLAWTLPLLVVGVGCDARVEPIDTVRNDVIVGDNGQTVTISSIQLRLRAEGSDETEINFLPSGDFGSNILSGPLAGASDLGTTCEQDSDCPGDTASTINRCVTVDETTSCWAIQQAGSSDVECGIYDIRFTDDAGNTCEIIINDGLTAADDITGQACDRTADCAGEDGLPFRCINGACRYSYAADGTYLCFIAERWDLSGNINATTCEDLF
ncbi:MAG: hypothetical protein AAFN74_26710 [Myxococcota bacterium]